MHEWRFTTITWFVFIACHYVCKWSEKKAYPKRVPQGHVGSRARSKGMFLQFTCNAVINNFRAGRSPLHERFFHRTANSMQNSFCSHQNCVSIKFCIWHKSCAVVTCAKFCCDKTLYNRVTLKFSTKFELRWKKCSRNGPLVDTFQTIFWNNILISRIKGSLRALH